jgi:hypothetical protein
MVFQSNSGPYQRCRVLQQFQNSVERPIQIKSLSRNGTHQVEDLGIPSISPSIHVTYLCVYVSSFALGTVSRQ